MVVAFSGSLHLHRNSLQAAKLELREEKLLSDREKHLCIQLILPDNSRRKDLNEIDD